MEQGSLFDMQPVSPAKGRPKAQAKARTMGNPFDDATLNVGTTPAVETPASPSEASAKAATKQTGPKHNAPSVAKPPTKRRPIKLSPSSTLPTLHDDPDGLSDDDLISDFLRIGHIETPEDLSQCDEARCAFEKIRKRIVALMIERRLMVFGGFEADMRERARRKAAGEELPDRASCGNPDYPDPFPTLVRACRHMEHQLAHLDNATVDRMCFDDQQWVLLVWQEAQRMALAAGASAFPDPWCRNRYTLQLIKYRRLRESTSPEKR
ncbi:hypothetical protein VRRI112168_14895 [Vreelandella rituensis]|uniref:Uncharacterized protein n=1 Tax=Vreelandella rituensis TaxID=2282306 RepID=A0A368U9K7_9GAMM|nr:hypothetical protein [Halomonas rituensis]RCV93790.1 hypothetical protein DU506_01135 [Halomonas rituensis]